jgi:hypothetical protein
MLDEDGSEIIGIRVRCVAEHMMPVSKLGEGMAQTRSRGPNADAPVTTAVLYVSGEDGTMCRVKLDIKYTPNPTREQASLGRFSFVSLFRINLSNAAGFDTCGSSDLCPLQLLTMFDLDAFVRVGRCIYEEAGVGETMVKEAIKRSAGSEVCEDWERALSRACRVCRVAKASITCVHAIQRAGQKRGGRGAQRIESHACV